MRPTIKILITLLIIKIKNLISFFMYANIKILIILFMRAQDEYRARLNSALLNSPLRSWAKILPHRPQACQVKIAKFHKKNFLFELPK